MTVNIKPQNNMNDTMPVKLLAFFDRKKQAKSEKWF